ncbi:hypothetical protein [Paenibacillus sp. Marseille-Q4541]|uniref:hypothetical protein n=1 Tax=Paenibacillus sp. Marseille-Q4541 TaxID=2831522 RepID=UPI001BAC33EB|nr:hypothetical protein [Paenibacillus sp. Marseille-Q4541]
MKINNKRLLFYLIWIIVGAVLLHYGNSLIDYYTDQAQKSYQLEGVIWIFAIMPFIYGLYLALLEGLPRALKLNWPLLLIVFVPSFLLLIYPILAMYFEIENIEIFKIVSTHQGSTIFGIVSGLTLIKSLTTIKT